MRYKRFFEDRFQLKERTFEISGDVDKLYKMSGFDSIVKSANETMLQSLDTKLQSRIMNGEYIVLNTLDTSILECNDCKKAHSINPVSIFTGILNSTSYGYKNDSDYAQDIKSIELSLNRQALKVLIKNKGLTKVQLRFKLKLSSYNTIRTDLSEAGIKTAIAHELSHWLSDSLYNSHIINRIKRDSELSPSEIKLLKRNNINMEYFEIDAQIHSIKELKGFHEKEWDSLTLDSVFSMYDSLEQVAEVIYESVENHNDGKKLVYIWVQLLIKRMNREGLLGKNMHSFPKLGFLFESCFKI